MNKDYIPFLYAFGFIAAIILIWTVLFAAPENNTDQLQFTVGVNDNTAEIAENLHSEGFIRNMLGYKLAYRMSGGHFVAIDEIQSGAYKLSKDMNAFEIVNKLLREQPYMKWVIIPEGLRKEQIAATIAESLDWTQGETQAFVDAYNRGEYTEGVYFPNSYLIPLDESPEEVAQRFITKFNEKFQPYVEETAEQNIKWTTLVNIAAIIQREASGAEDMPLIAGIIWNRLLDDMKLDIDATIQYIKGEAGNWWPQIRPEDKDIDSPFNTYIYAGIPPHPIANPGLDAIEAALYPKETDCLYYIHDNDGVIHCSENYEEHQDKIEKYL